MEERVSIAAPVPSVPTVAVPRLRPPDENVTLPVGAACDDHSIWASRVVWSPTTSLLGEIDSTVVVDVFGGGAGLTVTVIEAVEG